MIITLTGPSCAGKTTLEAMLKKEGFVNAISTTSRPQRVGEVDGKTYYFRAPGTFEQMVREGLMVEHVAFGGHYYGVSVEEVNRILATGKPVVIVCEPVGQLQIKRYCTFHKLAYHSVFICGEESVIAERFLNRFAGELIADKNGYTNQLVETYARRLTEMMTTERDWVLDANLCEDRYDSTFAFFDEESAPSIVRYLKHVAGVSA